MTRKSLLFTALGVGSAAAVLAAVERLLDHGAVRLAAGIDTAGVPEPDLPVTPVPRDAVTTVTTSDPASILPSRTWVVDDSTDWNGTPDELVVLPHPGTAPDRDAT
ncbi:hypothetical protein [Arthrobacter yangruifuii]|uniref:hypothetical protein n=1 Tax=Arthrobacter yangruifuii TaxID=2606616 RepID=UPI0011B65DD8|nr:hypothetical protein [Arthrobacter yangruifuii]